MRHIKLAIIASFIMASHAMANCPSPKSVKEAMLAVIKPDDVGELVRAALDNPKIPAEIDGEPNLYVYIYQNLKNRDLVLTQKNETDHYGCYYKAYGQDIIVFGVEK